MESQRRDDHIQRRKHVEGVPPRKEEIGDPHADFGEASRSVEAAQRRHDSDFRGGEREAFMAFVHGFQMSQLRIAASSDVRNEQTVPLCLVCTP